MTVLKARIGGAWVTIPAGADEVWVGSTAPADSATELWYDTSAVPAVDPAKMPRGYMGHAVPGQTTSILNTVVDMVGSAVTWTADPTRRYKVSLTTYRIDQAAAAGNASVRLTNAVNSQLASAINTISLNNGQFGFIHVEAVVSGLSGSQTAKGRINTDAGSCTLQAGGLLVVEDIGGI